MKKLLILFTILSSISLIQCGTEPEPEPEIRQAIVNAFVDNVALPLYADLDKSAANLLTEIRAYRQDSTEAQRNKVRRVWQETRVLYQQAAAFAFGPFETLKIADKVDTYPIESYFIKIMLQSGDDFSREEVESFNHTQRGFHLIEYLLWGDSQYHYDPETGADALQYMESVAEILADDIHELSETWKTTYKTTFKEKDLVTALKEISAGIVAIADKLTVTYLQRPIEDPGPPRDHIVSFYSDYSAEEFYEIIQGIRKTLGGLHRQNVAIKGLSDYVKTNRPSLLDSLASQLDDTEDMIEYRLENTFNYQAILTPSDVELVVDETRELHRLLTQITPLIK